MQRLLVLLAAVGVLASCGQDTNEAQSPLPTPPVTATALLATPSPVPTSRPATLTPVASPTPLPIVAASSTATATSTVEPTAVTAVEPTPTPPPANPLDDIELLLSVPVSAPVDCDLEFSDRHKIVTRCVDPTTVSAPLPGRVVFVNANSSGERVASEAPAHDPAVNWAVASDSDSFIVIDHGPVGPYTNVMSVLGSLESLTPSLGVGAPVDAKQELGTSTEDTFWIPLLEDRPMGEPSSSAATFTADEELRIARHIAEQIKPAIDSSCPLNLQSTGEIPNASRSYRNGTHRGVDFICAAPGEAAYAALDGTVIAVVSTYQDASPQDRNALLGNATLAGYTPRWTLNMLYGNHVVLEHEPIEGYEVVTIYAHLESVEEAITPGASISAGDRLGEIGNRGTSASAAGTTADNPRSIHLHWEIHIGGNYLGAGRWPNETVTLYSALLCHNEEASWPGC